MSDQSEGPSGPSAGFDFSKVTTGAWVSGGGALVLLISVFLSWYTAKVSVSGGISGVLGNLNQSKGYSGWESTDIAKLVFLLALVALGAWIVAVFVEGMEMPAPAWGVAMACGIGAIVLVLYRIVDKPGDLGVSSSRTIDLGAAGKLSVSVSAAWGIYFSLLAAIAVVVGAYLVMKESEGGLSMGSAAPAGAAATAMAPPPPPPDPEPEPEPEPVPPAPEPEPEPPAPEPEPEPEPEPPAPEPEPEPEPEPPAPEPEPEPDPEPPAAPEAPTDPSAEDGESSNA